MEQVNVRVEEAVAKRFKCAARGLNVSQGALFEKMMNLYARMFPDVVAKGEKIAEMEKRIREEG